MLKNNTITYKAQVWDIMQHLFGKFNDHQLHCVIYFDSHIDEKCLKKAVDISANTFPIIRSKFVEKSYFKFPYWEDCKFTSEDIVKIIETENPEKVIEKSIAVKIKENSGPQIIINVIRDRKCDSLCIVMNHMISDAAGFKEYLYRLSSIYSHLKDNYNYALDTKMGLRSTKQIFKNFSALDKMKILGASSKLSKYDSGTVFPLVGDNSNPFIETRKISRERFLLIKTYAKRNKVTINDVLLATYIRSLYKVLKINHLTVPCAVDLRKYIPNRQAEGICNLVSNIVCDIGNDIGETYGETLLKVKKSMDFEKNNLSSLKGPFMLEIVFNMLPYKKARQIVSKMFKNPPIHMTNIGIIDKNKLVFKGLNIKDTFISGSIKYKPYFQIAITTFDNQMTLSINFCGTEEDRIKIQKFLQVFDTELPQCSEK
ncbi:MAG: WS/DGAT domain-containing protein [Clostridium sp.]|nr:WS/DGAT domain-containing protein [Clostridium sp.]